MTVGKVFVSHYGATDVPAATFWPEANHVQDAKQDGNSEDGTRRF